MRLKACETGYHRVSVAALHDIIKVGLKAPLLTPFIYFPDVSVRSGPGHQGCFYSESL